MTREEFIKKYKNDCRYYFDGYYSDCIDDFLTNIYNDHEAQLKAKDEEIERLEDQLSSVHNIMYRNGYSDAIDCYDTFGNFNTRHKPNAKARSIVAMLFWEWKRRNRLYIENKYRNPSANLALYKQANLMQEVFQEAYKILKDTK